MKKKIKQIIRKCAPKFVENLFTEEFKELINRIESETCHLSYSQQAEDLTLQRFFGKKQTGFYVDIGAFHPVLYSNTKLFYDKGWKGINVEPTPNSIAAFDRERPRDINLNIAISKEKETIPFYVFNAKALNTFSKEHADLWKAKDGFIIEEVVDVRTFPLSYILDLHMPEGSKIDFFTIDVENLDLQVLESNNWQKYKPTAIVVEQRLDMEKPINDTPISKFLSEKGYYLYSITGGSTVYALEEH